MPRLAEIEKQLALKANSKLQQIVDRARFSWSGAGCLLFEFATNA